MSKPETNIISVPLANAYLNLNQEKDEIRQYEGFNKLNAPFYGGNLTPLWRKFLGSSGASSYTDEDENIYTIENGVFKVKDVGGSVTILKDDFQEYTAAETIIDNKTYKWYYNEEYNAVIKDTGVVTVVLNGLEIGNFNNLNYILYNGHRTVIVTSLKVYFYYEEENILTLDITGENNVYYVKPCYTIYNETMLVSVNNKYYRITNEGVINEVTPKYTTSLPIKYWHMDNQCDYSALTGNYTLSQIIDKEVLYQENYDSGYKFEREDSGDERTEETTRGSGNKTFVQTNVFETDYIGNFETKDLTLRLNPYSSTFLFNMPLLSIMVNNQGGLENVVDVYEADDDDWSYTGSEEKVHVGTDVYLNLFLLKKAEISNIDDNYVYIDFNFNKLEERNISKNIQVYESHGESYEYKPYTLYLNNPLYTITFEIVNSGYISNIEESIILEKLNIESCNLKYYANRERIGIFPAIHELKYTYNQTTRKSILSNSNYVNDNNTDYNINTTRGYAYNYENYFRLLVNNGYISAISIFNDSNYLGTLVSNFGTTGIEYFYVVTNTRLVYVDDKNKVHIINVIPFAGNEIMTVLLNRYFIFNAVGVNCYDSLTRTWSRVGLDWNNRFVIADYSESTDTKYYMTSAMFRTTDNTPSLSMLFNTDYLNHLPYTALTPQSAEDVAIQFYGTEEPNTSILYLGSFVYTNNEWTVYNDSTYDGMTAEGNSDNNLLIPVSLFTQYTTSYLNDIYAVMSDGFTPLYKNNNSASTIKFNYYIGSLIEDLGLDAIFIIQGQYYRLSNKIIYAYTYSGGTLIETQEICNVGSLTFVGASPSEAYFWSYANRTLYRFTGARTVESVVCADSITTIYATLYDTTTSSLYLSTNIGLVVYNSFGNFIIDNIRMATELTSSKLGITYKDENKNLYGLYYNAVDGEEVIPVTLETSFYGSSSVQNVINDTLYLKIFNKDNISKGIIKFGGYIQQNYGETKEIVSKVVEVSSEQFDKVTNNLLLRYQPDKQRGIGISWKIESDFPISFIGIGSSPTGELNVPKSNNPVITTQKYNI